MAAEDITLDELQAAFRDAGFTGQESDEGKTSEELAEAWGVSPDQAGRMLKRAHKLGILRAGKRQSKRIDGGACRVPVYSLIIAEKPKGKAKK